MRWIFQLGLVMILAVSSVFGSMLLFAFLSSGFAIFTLTTENPFWGILGIWIAFVSGIVGFCLVVAHNEESSK